MGTPDEDLDAMITEFGWAIRHVGVGDVPDEVPFSYTIGLTALGSPEFVVQNLSAHRAQRLLNRLGEVARDGQRFVAPSRLLDPTHEHGTLALIAATDASELTAVANRFGRIDAQQVVWCDESGRFPWDDQYDSTALRQPLLGVEPHAPMSESILGDESPAYVKVVSVLEQEDDWPPFETEGLWAAVADDGRLILDSTPFFTFGLSRGDTIRATETASGRLRYSERLDRGGHLSVRINTSDPAETNESVLAEFEAIGATGESLDWPRLVAIDITPDCDRAAVKALFVAHEAAERWQYEESDVDAHWESL